MAIGTHNMIAENVENVDGKSGFFKRMSYVV